jgi:hypothetical protein
MNRVFLVAAVASMLFVAAAALSEARMVGSAITTISHVDRIINISNPRGDISITISSENGTRNVEIQRDFENVKSIRNVTITPGHAEVQMQVETENGTQTRNVSVDWAPAIRAKVRERIRNMTCNEECPLLNITYNNSLRRAVIISKNMTILSNSTIEVDNGSVYILTQKNVRRELKVLPENASETAKMRVNYQLIKTVDIEDSDGNAYYAVKGIQAGKILGLFSTQMDVQTDVDVQSGDVTQVRRPWWNFLVF